MAHPKTIQSLQAGRGLAALAVVLFHADIAGHDFGMGNFRVPLFESGYLGVDFFFVLSGFIIYPSTAGRGRPARHYAIARLRRVYLPYLPIGIGIALLYTYFPGFSAAERGWSWLPTLTLLPVSSNTALSVAWTLKHEILFYALFGCFYFSGLLRPGLFVWGAMILGAATLGISGIVPMDLFLGVNSIVPLALINLEFLMGIAAAVLYRRRRGHPALFVLAPVPLILWLMLGADRDWSVLVGLSFALIILPVAQLERQGRFKVRYGLTFLGAASYSIYLAHGLAISATGRLFHDQPYWLVAIATAIAGVSAGIAYFMILERPLLRVAPGDRRHERLTGEEPAQPSAIM
jgi:peptidoglycan/LPS O-acetylase OafA/YrhL